jgi:hypothetical protein
MSGTWRDVARPIIAAVIAEVGRDDEKRLRAALRDAWPKQWGKREHHPYKVWLDEIKRQLSPQYEKPPVSMVPTKIEPLKDQMSLF